jgi:hypothetical protein
MLFKKYKNIGHSNFEFLRKIDMPLLITGIKNVGKKSLLKYLFPKMLSCIDLSHIPDLANSIVTPTLYINIELVNQDLLFTLIEKYCNRINFVLSGSSHKATAKLLSICFKYNLTKPSCDEIKQNISKIMQDEGIKHEISFFFNKTYHDILVELTLIQNKIDPLKLYDGSACEEIIECLFDGPPSIIRTKLYKLMLLRYDMHDMIKSLADLLGKKYISHRYFIFQQAAKYEYNMCMGNKDIYHVEAFLFAVKNRILANDKNGKYM